MNVHKPVSRIRGAMQVAVEDSLQAMTWLRPSDGALATLALTYAAQIDQTEDPGKIGHLGQQLMGALRQLGGTPVDRKGLDTEGAVSGSLAELRKARVARAVRTQTMDSSS